VHGVGQGVGADALERRGVMVQAEGALTELSNGAEGRVRPQPSGHVLAEPREVVRGHDVVGLQGLFEHPVGRGLDRLGEDADKRHQAEPDHQRGGRGGRSLRIADGVLSSQLPRGPA
jgi:hypothetical protein